MTAVVREVRHRLESSKREQTAATILVALMPLRMPQGSDAWFALTAESVRLADALRAELAKGRRE